MLLSLRHSSPDLISSGTDEWPLFFSWPPACNFFSLWHFHINLAYYNHFCHLVFHESTISWYWELERLIIHNSGKCCAPLFPVTPPFHPSLVFSSPPVPESPLNADFKKKEPSHPKKKGQHRCRCLSTHSPLTYAHAHKIKKGATAVWWLWVLKLWPIL